MIFSGVCGSLSMMFHFVYVPTLVPFFDTVEGFQNYFPGICHLTLGLPTQKIICVAGDPSVQQVPVYPLKPHFSAIDL